MAKLSQPQAASLQNILENFQKYEESGFGKVKNVIMMTNNFFPNSVFVRFETTSTFMTDERTEFRIIEIKSDGTFSDVNDTFKNPRVRYSFLGECIPFSKEQIEVVDGN